MLLAQRKRGHADLYIANHLAVGSGRAGGQAEYCFLFHRRLGLDGCVVHGLEIL